MLRQLLAALPALAATLSAAGTWSQFRGPGANGVAPDDPALPERWSATENVVWKTGIPGAGWSSPVVWEDTIFLTGVVSSKAPETPKKGLYFGGNRGAPADEHRWLVYALDFRTGKILWEREVHKGVPAIARHLKNTFASETPVTDGERVYFYFGSAGVYCFDNAFLTAALNSSMFLASGISNTAFMLWYSLFHTLFLKEIGNGRNNRLRGPCTVRSMGYSSSDSPSILNIP